jgi:hypothetical protein
MSKNLNENTPNTANESDEDTDNGPSISHDDDLDKEEEEDELEGEVKDGETKEKPKTNRGNIKESKKITLPFFLHLDTEFMDCPYLLSCHFLSTVLLHFHFMNVLSPAQIQQAAIQFLTAGGYKNTCYRDVDAAKIKEHVQIICTVDPDMLCWRNFHLCYLFSYYLEKKTVLSLEPYQIKLRRKCWYYVIIFLRQRRSQFLLLLDSQYLKSPMHY